MWEERELRLIAQAKRTVGLTKNARHSVFPYGQTCSSHFSSPSEAYGWQTGH